MPYFFSAWVSSPRNMQPGRRMAATASRFNRHEACWQRCSCSQIDGFGNTLLGGSWLGDTECSRSCYHSVRQLVIVASLVGTPRAPPTGVQKRCKAARCVQILAKALVFVHPARMPFLLRNLVPRASPAGANVSRNLSTQAHASQRSLARSLRPH